MPKITLNTIGSRYGSVDALNNNFDVIEQEFDNVLSLDGTTPNEMQANLSMGGNRVINVSNAINNTDAPNLQQVNAIISNASSGLIAQQREKQTASAAQTVVTLTGLTYFPNSNNLSVYVNGVKYYVGDAYTETSPTQVTFIEPLTEGDRLEFVTNEAVANQVGDAANISYTPQGAGATSTSVASKLRESVSVKDFGADPAASAAVNTAAIQAAADYCETNGAFLKGAPGTYATNGTITLNCSGDLSEMTISCPGATVSPAVRVGKTTGSLFGIRLLLKLPKVNNSSKTVAGWLGFESAIGIDIGNLYYSEITIPRVFGFGINLYVGGYTIGNAYNQYHILQLADGKVNMKLGGRALGAWSNENNYFCGNFSRSTSEGASPITGAYSIWLDGLTGNNVNNNVFYKPSVETNNDEFQFNFENAGANTVINPRLEVTGGGRIRFYSAVAGDTSDNNFFGGYQFPAPVFTFDGAASTLNKYYGSRTGDALEFSGNGIQLTNRTSSAVTAPHIQGFAAGQNALGKTESSTNWTYRLFANGMQFKQDSDSFHRVGLDGAGAITLGDGTIAPTRGLNISGSVALILTTPTTSGVVRNNVDNQTTLGGASFRWSTVFAGTGTINTSDEREKQDIESLSAAELRVAGVLKGLVKKYRFKEAVAAKGDAARVHVGVIAQEVMAAFAAEGLDPMQYGIICYDEWEAEEGISAGNRYGVRYEELLAFIIAAL